MINRRNFCITSLGIATLNSSFVNANTVENDLIKPFGALPSKRQYDWQNLKACAFVHFTVNTFTGKEWGYGDEDITIFNPSDFSADQIVLTAKSAGLKGLILTAKHHDGFCLWPSAFTEHSIKNTPFQNGKGDIVRDISNACKRHNLKFGVYLSPWDRNHAEYGSEAYVKYYHNQLEELTKNYGPLFEVWFDGANGGDGYYGGAREKRKIDAKTYYQWDKIYEIVRRNQPSAVTFADSGADVRWIGNENGIAGDPCWPTVDNRPFTTEIGGKGIRGGAIYNPAEVDVSIRPGWFWHEEEKPKTPDQLIDIYFTSIGRGANLLLNIAPDKRGRVPDEDVMTLKAYKSKLDMIFANNKALKAKISASSHIKGFEPLKSISPNGFWAASKNKSEGQYLQFDYDKPIKFSILGLKEDMRYGIRTDEVVLEIKTDKNTNEWRLIKSFISIGANRYIRLKEPVTASSIRLRVISGAASTIIGGVGFY